MTTVDLAQSASISVTALPEPCEVRGNVLTSGDDALDREAEDAILARLDRGDLWAWCEVRVRATWTAPSGREWHGDAILGCCSYRDEADWREPGGYHDQMVIEALEDLRNVLAEEGVMRASEDPQLRAVLARASEPERHKRTRDRDPAAWIVAEAEALSMTLRVAPLLPLPPPWEVAHTLSRIAALGEAYAALSEGDEPIEGYSIRRHFSDLAERCTRRSSLAEKLATEAEVEAENG